MSNKFTFPNESAAYRSARDELLESERHLREQIEKVAAQRRVLPLGGPPREDYVFDRLGAGGAVEQVKLSELFGSGKENLFIYSFMYGPKAERPCPLCTSFLDGIDGMAHHVSQRIEMAVVAKSPIRRIVEFAKERGWKQLRFISSEKNTYNNDYGAEDEQGKQWPMANVFVKKDDGVHHFWGSELFFDSWEGGDTRHIDLLWPLWNILDLTPSGRGADFYPKLSY